MAIQTVSDTDFDQVTGSGTVLVDFWAEWCGPCKMIAPIIDELAGEMPNVTFAKLNVDHNQQTAQKLGITAIPTLVLYKDGQVVDKVMGLLPKPQLKTFIEKHQ
ncbi:MAG: thioredoxin [Leptospiraceae bacterium]|nr:thioredoxin [Leptospiraceae bacterium]